MDSMKDLKVPQELRDKWRKEAPSDYRDYNELLDYIIAQAAQWGWDQREPEIQAAADAELKAICEWLHWQKLATHSELIPSLRAARRPKPPSLKEQALALLQPGETRLLNREQQDVIRQALEALPDE
jgi:hypothetical protein